MTLLPAQPEQPITLLQLSDSHLSQDPQAVYRGVHADANLASLRPAIQDLGPDAIVLSGDISEDASPASYWRMGGFVRDLAGKIAWIPGNHDEREVMAEIFDELGFDAGPIIEIGGWQVVLLDSARPNRPEGEADERRLAPVDAMDARRPALVFVHHQPVAVGAPWIDKYPLIEPDRLWKKLAGKPVKAVAFGHVHQVFEGEHDGIACLSAPSTAANGRRDAEKFTPSEQGPSARWFRLWPSGRWETGIL
ncbi:MAG: metallophosphoesterase [Xanthomonadales bacterium]|nr:metallophosphoesterase [Xanthomonadales bacterium]